MINTVNNICFQPLAEPIAPYVDQRAHFLGKLASTVLIDEARLTPKPALVDERGSGAHSDLTLQLMIDSAIALQPYFEKMARLAFKAKPTSRLREELANYGRSAEWAMYQVTAGSNSHRGAIWCLGLLVAATAMNDLRTSARIVAATAAEIALLTDQSAPHTDSHGQFVKRAYGIDGAIAEAQQGFPHVINAGLPHLRERRSAGAPEATCRLDALLMIMSTLEDTCLVYRGGIKALATAQNGAREVLMLGGTSVTQGLARLAHLDSELLRLNASPGGSADLLAATMFLDSLESMSVAQQTLARISD
ncbi:MAG TPA: triphosphoribosyl-dephospho-CoA synthase [Planktothrix sp.]|jgi:triphosphoribosyl-dephospho-CoA synthase